MNASIKHAATLIIALAAFLFTGCDKQPTTPAPPPTESPSTSPATEPTAGSGTSPATQSSAAPPINIKCPVSGESVDPKDATLDRIVYKGQTYVFCCPDCKATFLKDPDKAIASLAGGVAGGGPMKMK